MVWRRLALILLAVLGVALAALGVLFTPSGPLIVMLILAPGLAGLVGYGASIERAQHADPSSGPSAPAPDPDTDPAPEPVAGPDPSAAVHRRGVRVGLVVAGGTAAAVLVVAGLVAVAGAATGPLLVVAGFATIPWAWPRIRRRRHRRALEFREHELRGHGPAPVEPNPAPGPRPLVRVLDSLTTPALCAEWQRSFGVLSQARDPAARDDVAGLRRRYLDELERRDPDAFERWLAADQRPAGSNPARHLTGLGDIPDPADGRRDRSIHGHRAPGADHPHRTDHGA